MQKRTITIFIWLVVIIIITLAIFFLIRKTSEPGELDEFANCLKDKGAIFYGTFWCPYCQEQKAMFGKSAKLLNYVECSTQDGKGQLAVCRGKNIEGYPTWEFADGSREEGRVALEKLAEKTGCSLPQ